MTKLRDLAGKVVVITGANIGIGRAVAEAMADRGARLRLLCRSLDKAAPVVEELRARAGHDDVVAIACDLGSLATVRTAATALLARDEPLHVLVNNAGVAGQRGLTTDGFELHFGVNHLGHFLLTTLLLDRLRASAPARIVHVASGNHYKAPGLDWDAVQKPTVSITGLPEYGASKLANVLFSAELARRLAGTRVTTYAVNPGRVASNIWQRLPWPFRPLFKLTMLSTAEGAFSTIRAALDLEAESGRYFDRRAREQAPSAPAQDLALASELWERSLAWTADA
ncbi:MAG: SDR family NAD(P)-dependent oxidoreductase [Myxococcales bacterium]|nr:SDR family NAD(P)-dependent oxidoreductase [Myxococcales bacterium]